MILCLIRYLKGYVRISVYGFAPERFMNLCTSQNLLLWNVIRTTDRYEMNISIKGFFCLRPVARKTRTRIRVLERRGFPFLMYRYRKHRAFQAGLLICALMLWYVSCFIWEIELKGNQIVTNDLLYDFLAEQQIVTGIAKNKIICEDIEKTIRASFPQITWVSVKIDGVRLVLEMNENLIQPLPDAYTGNLSDGSNTHGSNVSLSENIFSNYTGIVRNIVTRNGIPLVTSDMEVNKGDMLVSGGIPIQNDAMEVQKIEYVKPDADIEIETKYMYRNVLKRDYIKEYYSGNYVKSMDFILGNYRIQSERTNPYEKYNCISVWNENSVAALFQKRVLYANKTVYECLHTKTSYSDEQLTALLENEMNRFVDKLVEKGIQIIENNVTIKIMETDGTAEGVISMIVENNERQETL